VTSLEPLLVDALATPLVRRSHLITSDPFAVRRRVRVVLRGLGGLFWLGFVLRAVGLHGAAVAGLRSFLAAGVSVGALSISVGTVIAFVLTLVAAMLFARTVTGARCGRIRAPACRGVPVVLDARPLRRLPLGFLRPAAAGIQLASSRSCSAVSVSASAWLARPREELAAGRRSCSSAASTPATSWKSRARRSSDAWCRSGCVPPSCADGTAPSSWCRTPT
jgi:hypothetical protein